MKPNSFTKLYVHYVFSPKGRESLLTEQIKESVQKYIYGIIVGKKCNPLAINGTSDHLHILTGLNPAVSVESLVRDIKRSSSLYINKSRLFSHGFNWQEGYGAFTVGYRELDVVYKYILNQKQHHERQNFKEEFTTILNEEGFKFDEKYLFDFYL
ncbi:MAG TPA: IS200/IS605 family transposase [Bacteroidales bacterium]|nr:IS200/IS605 family transposase [Bacteroidales bacterium]